MDLYNMSLDRYVTFNKSVISLNTKLFFMLQISLGVKFLKDNKIFHLDLKPQNTLIGHNLILKICDFGESYSE